MDDYWTPSVGQSEFNYSGSSSSGSGFDVGSADPISTILQVAADNNAWSAEQAQIQRDWQEVQNQKAMTFNSAEAQKNRDWQQYMSNTAHQREIADLQAAGLNPVLSATGGNGAPVTSGATAQGVTSAGAKGDTDESVTGAVMSWMANLLQAQTSILNTAVSAEASRAAAGMMAAASQYGSELSLRGSMYATDKQAQTDIYRIEKQYQGTMDSAKIAADAAKYGSYLHYLMNKETLDQNDRQFILNKKDFLLRTIGEQATKALFARIGLS